jgi:hypothetical protein
MGSRLLATLRRHPVLASLRTPAGTARGERSPAPFPLARAVGDNDWARRLVLSRLDRKRVRGGTRQRMRVAATREQLGDATAPFKWPRGAALSCPTPTPSASTQLPLCTRRPLLFVGTARLRWLRQPAPAPRTCRFRPYCVGDDVNGLSMLSTTCSSIEMTTSLLRWYSALRQRERDGEAEQYRVNAP